MLNRFTRRWRSTHTLPWLACAALAALGSTEARAAVTCGISAAGLNFGVYDPTLTTPNDVAGNLTVACDYVSPGNGQNLTYTVAFGTGSSGTFANRQLLSGTNRLLYNLYRDLGLTQVLGNGTGGTFMLSDSVTVGPGVGNGNRTTTYPIYGRMPARQDALNGTYTDTLVLTLTF